jgi:hypothetical protein
MLTIDQKREACIQHEVDWIKDGATEADLNYLMRHGWSGWASASDEEVLSKYQEITED